jgi:hypothetical protein
MIRLGRKGNASNASGKSQPAPVPPAAREQQQQIHPQNREQPDAKVTVQARKASFVGRRRKSKQATESRQRSSTDRSEGIEMGRMDKSKTAFSTARSVVLPTGYPASGGPPPHAAKQLDASIGTSVAEHSHSSSSPARPPAPAPVKQQHSLGQTPGSLEDVKGVHSSPVDRPTPIDTSPDELSRAMQTITTLEDELRKALDEIDMLRDDARVAQADRIDRQRRDAARIKEAEYSVVRLSVDLEAVVHALQQAEDQTEATKRELELVRRENGAQQDELLDEVERLEARLEREKGRRRQQQQESAAMMARLAEHDRAQDSWESSNNIGNTSNSTAGRRGSEQHVSGNEHQLQSPGATEEEEDDDDRLMVVEGLKEVIVRERRDARHVKNRLEHKIRKLKQELENKPVSLLSATEIAARCPVCKSKNNDRSSDREPRAEEECKWAGPRPSSSAGSRRNSAPQQSKHRDGSGSGTGNTKRSSECEENMTMVAELDDVTVSFDQENIVATQNRSQSSLGYGSGVVA